MSITKLLTGSLDNSANIATRDQFVSSFKSVFNIGDDVNLSIADIQAGTMKKEYKPGVLSPTDVDIGDKYAERFRYEMKAAKEGSEKPIKVENRTVQEIEEAISNRENADLQFDQMKLQDDGNLDKKMREVASSERTESVFETIPLTANQKVLDPIQKGLREGNFMTEEGMRGLKENVESGLGPYVGSSRAGEMSGGTFTRFLSGTEPDSSMLKTVGGLGALGLIGGGVNVMAGGDFSTGAMTTFGAASLLRGGGKLYNQMLGSFEENTMNNIIKASTEMQPAALSNIRSERLKQMKGLKFSETNKASEKMRDKLIKERTGTSAMNTRALTIGGGMLSGVAFTGRSDKRDYRRGFNKHRGNRI